MLDSLKGGIANILIIVLCLGMVGSGMIKLMALEDVVKVFGEWGFPKWFMYLVGITEFIIGLCIFIPPTRKYALLALIVLMHGAFFTHIVFGEYFDTRGPILVIVAAAALVYLQKGKKVV